MRRTKGFTLLETLVAGILLLATGTIVFSVVRTISQSANTMEDASNIEAALSRARQVLLDTVGSNPFLAIRAMDPDYVQIVQGIQAVPVATSDPGQFPKSKTLSIPSSTPTSPVNLGVVSNGLGHLNIVAYAKSGSQANIDPCEAGVEYLPTTAFIPAKTVEIATGAGIKRRYGNNSSTAAFEDDTLYLRENQDPWRPLVRGASRTHLALIYARDDGSFVRAPDGTDAPWEPKTDDLPGLVYPRPFFEENGHAHRLHALVIYADVTKGRTTRRHETVIPLSPLSGHEANQVTECSPGKVPQGVLILDIQAPPGAPGNLVRLFGPDNRVNGKTFGPGRHVLTVNVGEYQAVAQDMSGDRFGVPLTNNPSVRILPLNDPYNPTNGYRLRKQPFSATVSSFTETELTIRYEAMPALMRVISRNFFVIAPFPQIQIIPLTILAAAPPPAFVGPGGKRVVLGNELLGGFFVASHALSKVQEGRGSDFLLTQDTRVTPQDARATQIATQVLGRSESYIASSGWLGIGYPPFNSDYGMYGYPSGEFYGTLLVKPGEYRLDNTYWYGLKLNWLFIPPFFLIWWTSACYSIPGNQTAVVQPYGGGESLVVRGTQPFLLSSGDAVLGTWVSYCLGFW